MGYRMSWIGVRDKSAAALFEDLALDVVEEVEDDMPPETAVSGIVLPSGWALTIFDEVAPDEVFEPYMPRVSRDADTLICQIEEHVGHACLRFHRDGKEVWYILCDVDHTGGTLQIHGDFPAELRPQVDRLAKDDPLDTPSAFAEQLTGFRFDAMREASVFTVLERRERPPYDAPAMSVDHAARAAKPWWRFW